MGLEFVVNLRCFSATMEKTLKNRDKTVFFQGFCSFLNVFRRLFNFGWKTAQFDNKFESLEVSRFFWPPKCPLARINIEMEEILSENATVVSGLTPCSSGARSPSGGARICPRSGHFLVTHRYIHLKIWTDSSNLAQFLRALHPSVSQDVKKST